MTIIATPADQPPLMYGGLSPLEFILRQLAREQENDESPVSPFQSYLDIQEGQ